MLLELLGFLGAILLGASSLPQLIKTYTTKEVAGLSSLMLWFWSLGCLTMFLYVYFARFSWPLLINYTINCSLASFNLYLYYKYKNKK